MPAAPVQLAQPGCLNELGLRLRHALYYGASMADLPHLSIRTVLAQAVAMTGDTVTQAGSPVDAKLTWAQALTLVSSNLRHLVAIGDYAQATVDKMLAEMGLLSGFMTSGKGKPVVVDATSSDIQQWVESKLARSRRRGGSPAPTTRRLRITAARLFFTALGRLGYAVSNPTVGMHGPGRQEHKTRPLTDDEILLLRYTVQTLYNHRWSAAVALAEATATSSELSHVFVSDIDLDARQVRLPGTDRRRACIGYLSGWSVRQLTWRLNYLKETYPDIDPARLPVTYTGDVGGESAGVAGAKLMDRILRAAGLQGEPGVVAGSVAAAFGRRLWEQTHDLCLVAKALGRNTFEGAANEINVTIDDLPSDAATRISAAVYGADAGADTGSSADITGVAR